MNVPSDAFKNLGYYSIALATLIPAYLIIRWKASVIDTLSLHVAKTKTTYLVFLCGTLVWQTLFVLYMAGWFAPTFKLGETFLAIIVLGTACQVISAIVPDVLGWQRTVHRVAAYSMAVVMYGNTLWMIASPTITGAARIFDYVSFGIMTALVFLPFIYKPSKHRVLIFQSLFLLTFYATVLVSGYIQ